MLPHDDCPKPVGHVFKDESCHRCTSIIGLLRRKTNQIVSLPAVEFVVFFTVNVSKSFRNRSSTGNMKEITNLSVELAHVFGVGFRRQSSRVSLVPVGFECVFQVLDLSGRKSVNPVGQRHGVLERCGGTLSSCRVELFTNVIALDIFSFDVVCASKSTPE